jgi:ATP-dependent Clp protease ATP-binding subunit ClpB
MTSNIGSNWIQEEKDETEIKKRVQEALRAHFRPEFLNRIDEVVIFKRLNDQQLSQIVDIQLAEVSQRLQDKKINLQLSEAAKTAVAKEGYDPAFGARPLKRALQRLILDPLAKKVIAGEIREGSTVKVDFAKKNGSGDLTFSTK